MEIIETDHIQLREMSVDDFDDLHLMLSDPVTMRYYPEPFTPEMSRRWLEWNLQNYRKYGFGLWAVILKDEMCFIGNCGLTYQRVDDIDELEIGYLFVRQYWGRGLATEAAAACRDYVFDILKKERVISWMRPDNAASRRVAEKIGMSLEKETVNRKTGGPAVVYSLNSGH